MPVTTSRLSPETAAVLRAYMTLRGVSVRRLAAEIGIGPSYLAKLRAGTHAPSLTLARHLVQALDIPPDAAAPMLAESVQGVGYDKRPHLLAPAPPPPLHQRQPTLATLGHIAELVDEARQVHDLPPVAPDLVYLAHVRDGVKIGHSVNPVRRVHGFYGTLIAILPGGVAYEAELHKRFAEYRVPEWLEVFRPEGALAEFIASVEGEGLDPARLASGRLPYDRI